MIDRDARIAQEYVRGVKIPQIAARYAVPEAYVKRVIEDAMAPQQVPVSRWSLSHQGNRVLVAVLIGWVAWFATGGVSAWTIAVVAVIVYAVISLAMSLRKA